MEALAQVKIGFVTPWYGVDIPGGAEAATRRTAEQLKQAGLDVEVLTTCIRDFYADWGQNHYRAGLETINGVPVRRFPVEARDRQAFDQVNWRLMHNLSLSPAQVQTYIEEMIRAPTLYDFIREHAQEYLFLFIPYMFATTYYGARIAPGRSALIPCLHDESYARLDLYQDLFHQVKALILHADAEKELVSDLFDPPPGQIQAVVGAGVDSDFHGDAGRFRQNYGLLDTPFVLYAGRREPGKNTPLLLRYWQRYHQENGSNARLVLIGPGDIDLPAGQHGIIDLGFVPVQDKYDAFAAADLFCLPSVHESFSIVIMESWLAGTPVLVNGHCAVTREHCQKANGGLYFTNYHEFAATVDYLLARPALARRLGAQGRRYVLDNFRWEIIVDKYKQVLARMLTP